MVLVLQNRNGLVHHRICGGGNFDMSIQSLLSSLVMLIAPVEEVNIADKIYKGTVMAGKIIEKTEEGSWGASAHEEGYQITKDTILKSGGLK